MAFASFFGKNRKNKSDNELKQVQELPVAAIVPNRYQPRKVFKADSINELAETIESHGLLQPIIVREYEPDKYEIIAGERRFRAVGKLGWEKIPAIVDKMSDAETAAMALIENLQREELTPVEEAQAYQELLTQGQMKQGRLAEALGKSQSFIANKLRLLRLSQPVKEAIINGELSERHGRALLRLNETDQQIALHKILSEALNVKETENLVEQTINPQTTLQPLSESELAAMQVSNQAESPTSQPANLDTLNTTHRVSDEEAQGFTPQTTTKTAHKPKISGKSKDPKVAINTLRHSLKLIQDAGLPVEIDEDDGADSYTLKIKISKRGGAK
ncbi:nucleoid occlusion protein [Agrilactobacillus fermenti]|uniref:nucleoid occlusion protein n=1 Tax=Agrilactobacillus fermenti TaxID=2586909 RepID=UPI003A5BFD83